MTSTKWASVFSRMFLNLRGRSADWSRLTPTHRPFSWRISHSDVWLVVSFSSIGGLSRPFCVLELAPPEACDQQGEHTELQLSKWHALPHHAGTYRAAPFLLPAPTHSPTSKSITLHHTQGVRNEEGRGRREAGTQIQSHTPTSRGS